jgi:hypothetical protein
MTSIVITGHFCNVISFNSFEFRGFRWVAGLMSRFADVVDRLALFSLVIVGSLSWGNVAGHAQTMQRFQSLQGKSS